MMNTVSCFFFFFSSRRRHTRLQGDWSSDVCSSDLSLQGSGLRCTPQRYAVMALLMEHTRHPTAAEIFEAVNRLDPRSSRATTYNNLRDLVEAGFGGERGGRGRAPAVRSQSMRPPPFLCGRRGQGLG